MSMPASPARTTVIAGLCRICARRALLMLLACPAGAVLAEDRSQGTCVEVEIGGERSLSTECLNARLRPDPAPRPAEARLSPSEQTALTPSNQLGLFNRAALSNRMGSNFGKSAQPQRPARPPQPPPLVQGR